jgi:hypothetical protein
LKPIKDFLRTDTDTPVWSKLGRGLGKGEEKYEYSLELTLSLVPIYCWLATLSPEVSQYILVYRLEPQVQILFVQANFARIVQENALVRIFNCVINVFENVIGCRCCNSTLLVYNEKLHFEYFAYYFETDNLNEDT